MSLEAILEQVVNKDRRERHLCNDPHTLMRAYEEQCLNLETFVVGQPVMFKPHSGICDAHDTRKPGIIVELLEPFKGSDEGHETNSLAPTTFDALLGLFDENDGEFMIRPVSAHWLRSLSEEETQEVAVEGYCASLSEVLEAFQAPADFQAGDLVTWKHPSMKHLKWPDQVAVCVEVHQESQIRQDAKDRCSRAHYNEWDVTLGVIIDGDWELYYADSRRLKKWQQ